jgi:hypothetical protein
MVFRAGRLSNMVSFLGYTDRSGKERIDENHI